MKPSFLYHYTSVSTLELILKYKTIRFNALSKMDDETEQWSADGNEDGKQCFISSWTDASIEMPQMWVRYCKNGIDEGVRIRLPANPFSLNENKLPGGEEDRELKDQIIVQHALFKKYRQFLHETDLVASDLLSYELSKNPLLLSGINGNTKYISCNAVECYTRDLNDLLFQVQYVNDPRQIFPKIYSKYKNIHIADFSQIGKYKHTTWEWQKEWRYRLHFGLVAPGILHDDGTVTKYPLPFDHYDLILDSDKLSQMEITLSPNISPEAREKVHRIINEYNPSAVIHNSSLDPLNEETINTIATETFLKIFMFSGNRQDIAILYNNIGAERFNNKDIKSALPYLLASLAIAEEGKSEDYYFLSLLHSNISQIYAVEDKYKHALHHAYIAMTLAEKIYPDIHHDLYNLRECIPLLEHHAKLEDAGATEPNPFAETYNSNDSES